MFLRECLSSLRAQTHAAWEAIVVDDGSAATISRAIVASMKDDRIRHVRMPANMGVPVARNAAFRQMRGAFLLPLDADDMLAPGYLDAMVRAVTARPPQHLLDRLLSLRPANRLISYEDARPESRGVSLSEADAGGGCLHAA
jgi:glycosyltransferase involved in cell wall biosynthesis